MPIDDGELVAFLDGELSPDRKGEVARLLASDWGLRVRRAEIERGVELNMRSTGEQELGQRVIPPRGEVWAKLRRKLEIFAAYRSG